MDYRYVHKDGRCGSGWGVWTAIVNTVGADEAKKLPDLRELFPHNWKGPFEGDGTTPVDVGELYFVAEVEDEDGNVYGKLYK